MQFEEVCLQKMYRYFVGVKRLCLNSGFCGKWFVINLRVKI